MKKYRQLLLLIITLLSVSLFLIYRHEYNRLHYVLEVFNFFGQPCNMSEILESNTLANHHDWGPEPIWRTDDGIHVYSSYWLHTNEVKTIVAKDNRSQHAKTCHLWYEGRDEAIVGKFKYALIGRDDRLEAYYYFCSSTKYAPPYAVSYGKFKKRDMIKHVLNADRNRVSFNVTVCVPAQQDSTKTAFVEFLSYHTVVGVESFIVYTDNLSHRLVKLVSNLSNKLGIKVAFYPWNFPYGRSNLSVPIVEQDCLLRASKQSKFATTLNVDEYIVPSSRFSLYDVLSRFAGESDRLALPLRHFCKFESDGRKPVALQNVRVLRDDKHLVKIVYKNNNEYNVISAEGVDVGLMSVHKYAPCEGTSAKTYEDDAMLKFSTDFIRSTLYQLLLHKQL